MSDITGKMGAMMGGSVGLIMGFILGGYNIMKFGGGPDGPLRMLSKYMLGSGATFGWDHIHSRAGTLANMCSFFMSIGSVIRTEPPPGMASDIFYRVHQRPIIMPRRQDPPAVKRW